MTLTRFILIFSCKNEIFYIFASKYIDQDSNYIPDNSETIFVVWKLERVCARVSREILMRAALRKFFVPKIFRRRHGPSRCRRYVVVVYYRHCRHYRHCRRRRRPLSR